MGVLAICLAAAIAADADLAQLKGAELWGCRASHPAVVNPVVGRDSRDVVSLRGEWEFSRPQRDLPNRNGVWGNFNAAQKWGRSRTVRVPACWEAEGVGEPGPGECWDPKWDQNAKDIRHKYMGEGWYRKVVAVPESWKGRRIWIKLGGVKSVGWVWVNDRQVAHVSNYCATEKYEITDLVEPGREAKIVIDVDNRKPSRKGLMSAMHKWGGVYRDVELEATPEVFIDDAWVRGDFDARCAEAHVAVEGARSAAGGDGADAVPPVVRFTVEGATVSAAVAPDGETVLRLPLAGFRPWSPERPNLYTGLVELVRGGEVVHARLERFGVRKFEVKGSDFLLNGRPFFVRGFGDDAVYPLTGVSPADRDVHRSHLAKARAAGFNFVRLHTHCELPEYFEAADELGVMIQAELPYYSDVPCEGFEFDPVRDVTELWRNYRRHPSFCVYSTGNEGSFGPELDRRLHQYVKAMDPDRLKISQDSNRAQLNPPESADYCGGPIKVWPRGSYDPHRPFVAHEYLNLCVKLDSRGEGGYTGAWLPPVTRAARGRWLSRFGLDHDWGDRLQDAQHALQAVWQKRGIESARADAGCDGYHFWTIADVVVWNEKSETYSAQGLFDPLWNEKPHGLTAGQFAVFNSPLCVLADFHPSNVVFTAGERISVDVGFANFGEEPIADGVVEWKLGDVDGAVLAGGAREAGALPLGPVRWIAALDIPVPAVAKPARASLSIAVRSCDGKVRQSNEWPLWLFPRGPSFGEIAAAAEKRGVVVAEAGSDAARAAVEKGLGLVSIAGANGKANVLLGWWWMGQQVGTAIKDHPAFGDFPREDVMTPLWFRLVKDTGLPLPAADIPPEGLIVVGEGGEGCYCYLAERRVGRSRVLECHGLDLASDLPEGNSMLQGFVDYLADDLEDKGR